MVSQSITRPQPTVHRAHVGGPAEAYNRTAKQFDVFLRVGEAAMSTVSTRSQEEADLLATFACEYQRAQMPVMRDIERDVCGCDYGGTSWTTRKEAKRTVELLALRQGTRLLDVGAGSGWPRLYFAQLSGCDVTLVDIPIEGLRIAALRAAADRLPGACWVLVSDGAMLPFADRSFAAIEHSDVLCCLEAKASVLSECRRVIQDTGRMVFSVISIAPLLSHADLARAEAAGPPFKVVSTEYPSMLVHSGWRVLSQFDVTPAYGAAVQHRLHAEEANASALTAILNEDSYAEMIVRRRGTVRAIGHGLLKREIFVASPG
jgi:ubiquinone/menaquinone biosynthesis C-methylase UbiE